MKRVLVLSVAAAVLLAIPASHLVFGKAHVRLGKAQICHKGRVIDVGGGSLSDHVGHGDCQLPACDFNNAFFKGDPCSNEDRGDGKCAVANERLDAGGATPACPAGTF